MLNEVGTVALLLTHALIQNGSTALRTASFNGHTDVVRLLVTRGATVNIV